eukprot:761130-Prorocentrum_minimum.AAC.3
MNGARMGAPGDKTSSSWASLKMMYLLSSRTSGIRHGFSSYSVSTPASAPFGSGNASYVC